MRSDLPAPIDFTDASQRLAQDFLLVTQLRFVRDVLVVTTAAGQKMRARRGGPLRRRRDHPLGQTTNEFLLALRRFDGDDFAGNHVGNKDGRAVVMRKPVAAVNQFFDRNFHRWCFLQPAARC